MSHSSPPAWARSLNRIADTVIRGGRGSVPLNVVIDVHKATTGLFVLVLMQAYDVFTPSAWVYLGLHGSYGVAWVVKDLAVGDKKWRHRVGLSGVLGTWLFLTLYWVAPFILILGQAGNLGLEGWTPAGPLTLGAAVLVYVIGLVLMIGADAQKNATLAARTDGGLITSGFFARVRHPNYLGEMMIYGAFAAVVGHWLPWAVLGAIWLLFFVPNMMAIEASLSRYPEYDDWKRRTGFIVPSLRG